MTDPKLDLLTPQNSQLLLVFKSSPRLSHTTRSA